MTTPDEDGGILLCAFGPFADRPVNGSATIAAALAGTAIGDAVIRVAVLPVAWGEPERALPPLLAAGRPDVLLGLGEGYPDRIACERVAHNRTETRADIHGAFPAGPLLHLAGPSTRRARLPSLSGLAAPLPVEDSGDAGAFLCNAWLFTALATPVRACGFLHLPPQADMPGPAYVARYAMVVRAVLERARQAAAS